MPDLLGVLRGSTEWFINAGPPSEIILTPNTVVKVAGKGTKRNPGTPRNAQLFKKIWPGGDGKQDGTQDGITHKFDMIIVGLWDCEAAIGDTWTEGNQKYVIHSEYPFNNYERKFGVNSFGDTPSD